MRKTTDYLLLEEPIMKQKDKPKSFDQPSLADFLDECFDWECEELDLND